MLGCIQLIKYWSMDVWSHRSLEGVVDVVEGSSLVIVETCIIIKKHNPATTPFRALLRLARRAGRGFGGRYAVARS